MHSNLADWKTTYMNMIGRTTLAKAYLSSIPSHVMQVRKLSSHTTKQIQKNFIWGTTPAKKKMYLVGWEIITKPKSKGRLGIQKAKCKNRALHVGLA